MVSNLHVHRLLHQAVGDHSLALYSLLPMERLSFRPEAPRTVGAASPFTEFLLLLAASLPQLYACSCCLGSPTPMIEETVELASAHTIFTLEDTHTRTHTHTHTHALIGGGKTTIILGPSACGGRLRAAVLAPPCHCNSRIVLGQSCGNPSPAVFFCVSEQ